MTYSLGMIMSNYIKNTKNPKTGKFEPAYWLDDYFAAHEYAVQFPDGSVYDPLTNDLETNEEPVDHVWDTFTENRSEFKDSKPPITSKP